MPVPVPKSSPILLMFRLMLASIWRSSSSSSILVFLSSSFGVIVSWVGGSCLSC